MNKKLIATILLFITNSTILDSAALPAGAMPVFAINPSPKTITPTITTLDQMQQGYASKANNDAKSQFISQILGQDSITLDQKIINIENLKKVINAEISLYSSGWLWNEPADQAKINWLYEKQALIDRELKETQWKASSFGYQVTVQAATMASYYFMAVLLAYICQGQYAEITGDKTIYSFGQIAAMPITKIIELASSASIGTINTVTSPTSHNILSKIYAGIVAAGAVGYDYLTDMIDAIGTTVPTAAQKEIGDIAQLIASKIKTTQSIDKTTQTQSAPPTAPSNSWMPPIITNPMKEASNYLEQKNMIHQLQENLSKNQKLINLQIKRELNKAVTQAIQKNESTNTYLNPMLHAKLEAIETQGKQQQAKLKLQTLQFIKQIENGEYKKS